MDKLIGGLNKVNIDLLSHRKAFNNLTAEVQAHRLLTSTAAQEMLDLIATEVDNLTSKEVASTGQNSAVVFFVGFIGGAIGASVIAKAIRRKVK